MAYAPKAAGEAGLWMTLAAAAAHVQRSDRCTQEEAEIQIRAALGDLAVAFKFDDVGPKINERREPPSTEQRYTPQAYWKTAEIDWMESRAVPLQELTDEGYRAGFGGLRPMLLLRSKVIEVWPEAIEESITAGNAPVRRGRKKGSGSFEKNDLAILEKADERMAGNSAMSLTAALTTLLPEIEGAGTPPNRVARVRNRRKRQAE